MKSAATVTFSQICTLYVVLRCSPALTAPHLDTALHQYGLNSVHTSTIQPYYVTYNSTVPYKYPDEHEPLETLDEKIEENFSETISNTPPVIGIINDDNPAKTYNVFWSKQKDFKYHQSGLQMLQSWLEALSSENKIKTTSMAAKESFGEELTTSSFNDVITTGIPHTKHPRTNNTTVWLYSRGESESTPLITSYTLNATTTTWRETTHYPTTPTTAFTTIPMPNSTTTQIPTTTSTQMPLTTTTQRPQQKTFICTLCVIIVN